MPTSYTKKDGTLVVSFSSEDYITEPKVPEFKALPGCNYSEINQLIYKTVGVYSESSSIVETILMHHLGVPLELLFDLSMNTIPDNYEKTINGEKNSHISFKYGQLIPDEEAIKNFLIFDEKMINSKFQDICTRDTKSDSFPFYAGVDTRGYFIPNNIIKTLVEESILIKLAQDPNLLNSASDEELQKYLEELNYFTIKPSDQVCFVALELINKIHKKIQNSKNPELITKDFLARSKQYFADKPSGFFAIVYKLFISLFNPLEKNKQTSLQVFSQVLTIDKNNSNNSNNSLSGIFKKKHTDLKTFTDFIAICLEKNGIHNSDTVAEAITKFLAGDNTSENFNKIPKEICNAFDLKLPTTSVVSNSQELSDSTNTKENIDYIIPLSPKSQWQGSFGSGGNITANDNSLQSGVVGASQSEDGIYNDGDQTIDLMDNPMADSLNPTKPSENIFP